MSLLIMSIGVVSVFTLFPLSVLRSIQATQRTNAKIQLLNVKEQFEVSSSVLNLHTPPPLTVPAVSSRFRGQWQSDQIYTIGDVVFPTTRPGTTVPVPNLWYVCVNAVDNMGNPPFGYSGYSEPLWSVSGAATIGDVNASRGGFVAWQALPVIHVRSADQVPHNDPLNPPPPPLPNISKRHYVIDPLGWAVAQSEQPVPGWPHVFGNKTDKTLGTGVLPVSTAADPLQLLRINGSLNTETAAEDNVALQDVWEEVVRAEPVGAGASSVTFPPTIDLTGIGGYRRVILTSTDGSMTISRNVTGIAGQVVNWGAQFPFPARFPGVAAGAPDVGLARIETFDRRYTWFMTVRKDAVGNTTTKVVIVFNREFKSADEHVYDTNFANGRIDIDLDGYADGDLDQDGTVDDANGDMVPDWNGGNEIRLSWLAAEPDPLLKPGNFLFDARNVEWYRIQDVIDQGAGGGGRRFAYLRLDRNVQNITPSDLAGPPDGPAPVGRAILMRGIIDVFDL